VSFSKSARVWLPLKQEGLANIKAQTAIQIAQLGCIQSSTTIPVLRFPKIDHGIALFYWKMSICLSPDLHS
jgi:hypothetical protein